VQKGEQVSRCGSNGKRYGAANRWQKKYVYVRSGAVRGMYVVKQERRRGDRRCCIRG